MGKIKLAVIAFGILFGLAVAMPGTPSLADSPASQAQTGVNDIGGSDAGNNGSLLPMIHTVVNVLLFVTGAIAVIMVIWGGIRYVTSRGEASEVTAAKNTILYAIVGLVVVIFAYAIVQFVVNAVAPAPAPATQPAPKTSGPTQ